MNIFKINKNKLVNLDAVESVILDRYSGRITLHMFSGSQHTVSENEQRNMFERIVNAWGNSKQFSNEWSSYIVIRTHNIDEFNTVYRFYKPDSDGENAVEAFESYGSSLCIAIQEDNGKVYMGYGSDSFYEQGGGVPILFKDWLKSVS